MLDFLNKKKKQDHKTLDLKDKIKEIEDIDVNETLTLKLDACGCGKTCMGWKNVTITVPRSLGLKNNQKISKEKQRDLYYKVDSYV